MCHLCFYTDDDLEVKDGWQGVAYGKNILKSMHDVVRNRGTTKAGSEFENGVIDLLNVDNMCTRSNIGGGGSIGPRGERNLLTKIPITNNYGYALYERVVALHGYIDVSKPLLSALEFKRTAARECCPITW